MPAPANPEDWALAECLTADEEYLVYIEHGGRWHCAGTFGTLDEAASAASLAKRRSGLPTEVRTAEGLPIPVSS